MNNYQTMDRIRITLVVLHVLISIFLMYHLHPKLSDVTKPSENEKPLPRMIVYLTDLFRIGFYHASCILAIWYSRRYAAGMIRATGVLLIGEFLEIFAMTIQHLAEKHEMPRGELIFDLIYVWLFIGAMYLTYRLAKMISKLNKDLLQVELLTTATMNDLPIDGRGDFSLV